MFLPERLPRSDITQDLPPKDYRVQTTISVQELYTQFCSFGYSFFFFFPEVKKIFNSHAITLTFSKHTVRWQLAHSQWCVTTSSTEYRIISSPLKKAVATKPSPHPLLPAAGLLCFPSLFLALDISYTWNPTTYDL